MSSVPVNQLELLNRELGERYRVSHAIGRGGMATVYRADDLRHRRPVALKVLQPDLAASIGSERFLREITVTARLDHPHILPLLDSGEAAGLLYYVMPLVDGESLRQRLAREKQLPLEDALGIAREVADALSYAHGMGIVHRDVKPENILLSGDHARVADFGIARAVTSAGHDTLTLTGMALGTTLYMSPEQATGARAVDERSDVYSLGCVLYEMLAGHPPFTGATPQAVLARKSLEPVPSIRIVRSVVPPMVDYAVKKALSTVPADRFASAADFASALAAAAVGPQSVPNGTAGGTWRLGVGILAAGVLAALALAADIGGVRTRLTGGAAGPTRIESVAVLPLENLSGDAEQDYLAAGLHEALIVDLGRLRGLRKVTARPSVMRYSKSDKTPQQIGQELGVDALISGAVMPFGDRVRITASLIHAATEESLWSNGYERDLRDVLSLQNEIIAAIAREVQVQLSPEEREKLGRARRVHPEAYQAYLKGKFQLNKLTPEGSDKGIALLNQAIAIDSTEALAYSALAQAFILLELFRPASSQEGVARAKAAALKAVQLDETLAEAHVALSIFRGSKEWDYAGAEKGFVRALELNPNLAEAHIAYAQHLTIFGEEARAIAEWKRGTELDPLSPLYTAWYAGALWEFGRLDEAVAEANKALELQPDFPVALFVIGLSQLDKGEFEEAIATHKRALEKYPNQSFSWVLARTYAVAGRTAEARRILARLKTSQPGDVTHPWFIAAAYTALGEHEEALTWLERAFDERILFMANLARERAAGFDLRPLRSYPRFQVLLRRLNLADSARRG